MFKFENINMLPWNKCSKWRTYIVKIKYIRFNILESARTWLCADSPGDFDVETFVFVAVFWQVKAVL